MNNSIKRFSEDIESIEVPTKELEKAIYTGIKRGTATKIVRKTMYASGVAVLFICLLLGSGFVSPAVAKVLSEIPFLGSVLPYSDNGLRTVNEQGLIKPLDETSVDQNISITITEVYFDNSRLQIGYYIPLEGISIEELKQLDIIGISDLEVYLDGKRASGVGASNDYKGDHIVGIIDVREKYPQLTENPVIKINIFEILGKKGEWLFEFDTERVQERTNIVINKSIQTETFKFTVKDMEVTPSTTRVNYELQIPTNPNLVNFDPYSLEFTMLDKSGSPLELIKTGTIFYEHMEDVTILKSVLYFEPFNEIRDITINPYIQGENENAIIEMKLE